ncbi:MAG: fused MFS/spermidine synthase [Elusimicrobia bacterium]|nr:fused MFS/spermidine synthase [Elusimicrobiota bacterium]
MPTKPAPKLALLAVFFLSGAAALAYEIVWVKWIEQITGSAAHATAAVLSVWMGAMAAGSFAFGRLAERTASPWRLYAALEALAGLYAVCAPGLLPWLSAAHDRAGLSASAAAALVAAAGAGLPAALLGGTWPAFCRGALTGSGWSRELPALYAANTLGAAAGCFATGFWLIGTLGLRGTNACAALISLAVGAAVFALAPGGAAPAPARARLAEPAGSAGGLGGVDPAFLAVAAGAGFVTLAFELVAFRGLRLMIGSTVYALSTMLAVFLAGLAGGGLLAERIVRSGVPPARALAAAQVAAGLLLVWTSPLWPHTWGWFGWLSGLYGDAQARWTAARLVHFGVASSALLLPALCLGACFPLANAAGLRAPRARALGALYAASTLGAVLGPPAAAFWLVPALGLRGALLALAALSCALGVLILLARGAAGRRGGAAAALACAAALALTLDRGALAPETVDPGTLYYRDGVSASIRVERRGKLKALVTDGLDVQGGDPGSPETHPARLGLLPLLLGPAAPKRALQIGLGTGINAAPLAASAGSLEIVELLPELPEAARLFARDNEGVLDHPRARVILDDGRGYLRRARAGYDLVVSDLFFPENAGSGQLYAREHFAQCRRVLAPGGLVAHWLPLHQVTPAALGSIVASFLDVFPEASLWWGTTSERLPTAALVAGLDPRGLDAEGLGRRLKELAPRPAAVGWAAPEEVLALFIAGPRGLRRLAGDSPLNTDDFPFVETQAPRIESDRGRTLRRNLAAMALLARGEPLPPLQGGLPGEPLRAAAEARRRALAARLEAVRIQGAD